MADNGTIEYGWFVGASSSDGDCSDQMLAEGRWENMWDNKYHDLVKQIKVGDRIALKSAYTKKNGLPFDANGRTVGVMGIKAIGVVTKNLGDGKNIEVKWSKLVVPKTWYGPGTMRQTIYLVKASDGIIKNQLLEFTFGDKPQDYSLCEEYYGNSQDITETELDDTPTRLVADEMPRFFKISHTSNYFDNDSIAYFLDNQIVALGTRPWGCFAYGASSGKGHIRGITNKDSNDRFQEFLKAVKKGTYFYLCKSSEQIFLLGRITSENWTKMSKGKRQGKDLFPVNLGGSLPYFGVGLKDSDSGLKSGEWYYAHYEIVAVSKNSNACDKTAFPVKAGVNYDTLDWMPCSKTHFADVPNTELDLFEELILERYFGKTVNELISETMDDSTAKITSIPWSKHQSSDSLPLNQIVFGAPGTGKSYRINQKVDGNDEDVFGSNYERVTFHPDYTYANFVGAYKPVSNGQDISYEYVPGPFMTTLVKAVKSLLSNTPERFLLIIEEINRANVAAVFGDVFQLLDRNKDHISEYSIATSKDMRKYLMDELNCTEDAVKEIRIPSNMYIWATMNSADQGVFPLDTAFKRRWNFEYIDIDENEEGMKDNSFVIEKIVLDGDPKEKFKIVWNKLRHAINDRLTDMGVNEDKLLGPYFIAKSVMEGGDEAFIDAFKYKVLMYLYEDAAKHKHDKIFAADVRKNPNKRFSQILKNFDNYGLEIFLGESFKDTQIISKVPVPVVAGSTSGEENVATVDETLAVGTEA